MPYSDMDPRYKFAASLLSKRWTLLIIRILLGGKKRFSEFKLQIPQVSDRLLSERLQELEEQGILLRTVQPTKPVLIEYELSARGIALEPVVEAVQNWGEIWVE